MAATAPTSGSGRDATAAASKPWMLWTGRVFSAIPVLMMIMSATMKLTHSPQFIEQWVNKFGYPASLAVCIGLLELACVAIYVIPKTAVLGAVLLTGYLGGAVATHTRIGDPSAIGPVIFGVLVWGGLYLRDERIRDLLPLRKR